MGVDSSLSHDDADGIGIGGLLKKGAIGIGAPTPAGSMALGAGFRDVRGGDRDGNSNSRHNPSASAGAMEMEYKEITRLPLLLYVGTVCVRLSGNLLSLRKTLHRGSAAGIAPGAMKNVQWDIKSTKRRARDDSDSDKEGGGGDDGYGNRYGTRDRDADDGMGGMGDSQSQS